MARIVDLYREQYNEAHERFEKMCIAANIVKQIQESGSRFLQRTPEGWTIAEDDQARMKIGKALRYTKAPPKAEKREGRASVLPTPALSNPMEPTSSKRVRYDETAPIDFDLEDSFW